MHFVVGNPTVEAFQALAFPSLVIFIPIILLVSRGIIFVLEIYPGSYLSNSVFFYSVSLFLGIHARSERTTWGIFEGPEYSGR
jgi:hypothetical protein